MTKFAQIGVLLAGVALLGGCGQQKTVDVKNASPGEVAAKVDAAGVHFTPGAWETTVAIKDFSVEGMPPEMAAAMKQAMAKGGAVGSQKHRSCLTPEKAAKPDSNFFGKNSKNCQYKNFSMGGGKIAGVMTCSGKDGSETVTMDGTYAADSYTMDMSMAGDEHGKTMTTHLVATAHHVGDCRPDDRKD